MVLTVFAISWMGVEREGGVRAFSRRRMRRVRLDLFAQSVRKTRIGSIDAARRAGR
jgi:hypothetical protein